jgi:Fe-S cluster biogenesis protein NfuA
VDTVLGGFLLHFSNLVTREIKVKENIKDQVRAAIEEVRPNLQADGGDVELVDVKDGVVMVRLKGACAGCPMSTMTVKWGVENFLKKKVQGITRVETV